MDGSPGRLEIIAVLVTLVSLALLGRSLLRTARSIRARFTFGAPYRAGTIADNLLGILLILPVVLLAAGLGFLAVAQTGFQPDVATVRVAQVEARRSGWATMRVRLAPDPGYPADRLLEGEITGARWAIVGTFVQWDKGVRWLGLRDGHRLRHLVGTNDTTGTTPIERADRAAIDALPSAGAALAAAARFVPFLTVREEASPWFPMAEKQILILYATGSGYLAESVAEGSAPRY
jgi:hypothetical protein